MPNPRLTLPHHDRTRDLRAAVASLCEKFPLEYWESHDQDKVFPEEFFRAFADAGFLGVIVPEEYGGGGGSLSDLAVILEEVAASGGALNACSSVHIPLLLVPTLLAHGTETQKQTILPKVAAGELFTTFGVTEPDAGTETTKTKTFAREVEGGYRIDGTKVWNSGALRADKVLLLTRTSQPGPGDKPGHGLTLFLTDFNPETINIRAIPKLGRNAVASAELFIENHFAGPEDVVGQVGEGFYHLLSSLNGERLLLASEALGMGRWALEHGRDYANDRVVFDRPIGMNQAVQHPLAKGYLHLTAAAAVVHTALAAVEEHGAASVGTLANSAKYLATEAAFMCTDDAMQVFGGYSFAREYHIGRYWTESRLQRIAPVNNQMILNYIAERALGLPRSY